MLPNLKGVSVEVLVDSGFTICLYFVAGGKVWQTLKVMNLPEYPVVLSTSVTVLVSDLSYDFER